MKGNPMYTLAALLFIANSVEVIYALGYNGIFQDDKAMHSKRHLDRCIGQGDAVSGLRSPIANVRLYAKWNQVFSNVANETQASRLQAASCLLGYAEATAKCVLNQDWVRSFMSLSLRNNMIIYEYPNNIVQKNHCKIELSNTNCILVTKKGDDAKCIYDSSTNTYLFVYCGIKLAVNKSALEAAASASCTYYNFIIHDKRIYLVFYYNSGVPGIVTCIDTVLQKPIWRKSLFSLNAIQGKTATQNIHFVHIEIDGEKLYVYGFCIYNMYFESFVCSSGATVLKFSTNFWDKSVLRLKE